MLYCNYNVAAADQIVVVIANIMRNYLPCCSFRDVMLLLVVLPLYRLLAMLLLLALLFVPQMVR